MRYRVKVILNSREPSITQEGDFLNVKIDAPPIEGKANRRLIELISDHFAIPQGRITLVSGYRSRSKVIEIKEK